MLWIGIGLIGQAIFSLRFIIQWIASEKAQKSVIPNVFWYLSIAGSLTLLSYAIHQRDPVFILGQAAGSFIYLRNLILINKDNEREGDED
ncbi:lipid-A-disaccharide synthase N-terminal domain-containing protein [Orenia marismortui]|nr:lipid-A-disaccharide synthase N-terminal domain-containing protein [Orenia marismortui]